METSTTLSGAPLLSCDLDAACQVVDCEALTDEFTQALQGTPAAAEVVAHFCGLDYVDRLTSSDASAVVGPGGEKIYPK